MNFSLDGIDFTNDFAPISSYLSGKSAFEALKEGVEHMTNSAPDDHAVVIQAFNLTVRDIFFVEPHMLIFSGTNCHGHSTTAVAHFSQLVAHIIYVPHESGEHKPIGFHVVHEKNSSEKET